jgi:ferredoxin, 2Fe-2S
VAIHRVTFLPHRVTVEVDDTRYPLTGRGRSGSLLDIALANAVELGHDCGGQGACTTCHVIVRAGAEHLSAVAAEEDDRLDLAAGLTRHSRLACQAIVHGDVAVEIPRW